MMIIDMVSMVAVAAIVNIIFNSFAVINNIQLLF